MNPRLRHAARRLLPLAFLAPLTAAECSALVLLTVLVILPGVAPGLLTWLTHPLVTAWAGHLTR